GGERPHLRPRELHPRGAGTRRKARGRSDGDASERSTGRQLDERSPLDLHRSAFASMTRSFIVAWRPRCMRSRKLSRPPAAMMGTMLRILERVLDTRATVYAACGVTLALGLFFIFVWSPLPWGWKGIDFYYEIAQSLARGEPFPTLNIVWGYAYFL